MSKSNKRSNKNKSKRNTSGPVRANALPRTDYLAILPAVFMCLLTFLVLLMDVAIPGLAAEQYQDYPALYRIVHIAIVCAGALFWLIYLKQNGIACLAPASFIRRDTVYVLFFAVFLLLVIVSTIVNGLDEKAIHGVSFRNIGVFHIFAFFLIYCFLSAQIRRQSFRTAAVTIFIATADVLGAFAVIDRFVAPFDAFGAKKELSTIFFNGNHYGYFLTMAVLASAGLFLYHSDHGLRILGLLSMALNGFVLALNNSFGCILAVAVALVLFFIMSVFANGHALKSFLLLFLILIALGLAGAFASSGIMNSFQVLMEDVQQVASGGDDAASAGHNRWLLWTQTVDYILQRPILGYGCEGISDMIMADTGRGNPHCELLSYAAYFGIPAAAAYTLGMLAVLARFFRRSVLCDPASASAGMAACGYFISSLFGVPMFYTAPFFFIFLGLSLRSDAS